MAIVGNVIQLPNEQEVEQAKQLSRTLSRYTNADRVHLSINGSNSETDELVTNDR